MEQWKKDRSVRITASRFGDVLARPSTKRYRYYMEDLIDALNGHKKVPRTTPWFDHGREMEAEAVLFYEWQMQKEVEKFGCDNPKSFVHPKYDFISCSPDVKEDPDGGAEFKCHTSYTEFKKARNSGMPSRVKPQVQGTLWIMEKKWWNYVSYYRNGEKRLIHIHCVYPDLDYHKMLEEKCLNFWEKIQGKLKCE